jgi:hypothetical protein
MAETAGANPCTAVLVRLDIEDDVVRVVEIACYCEGGALPTAPKWSSPRALRVRQATM